MCRGKPAPPAVLLRPVRREAAREARPASIRAAGAGPRVSVWLDTPRPPHAPTVIPQTPGATPVCTECGSKIPCVCSAFQLSAFRNLALRSRHTPAEPHTAVPSADPTGPGVAGSATSRPGRCRHPAVRRSVSGCISSRRRRNGLANAVAWVCRVLGFDVAVIATACGHAHTTPSRPHRPLLIVR